MLPFAAAIVAVTVPVPVPQGSTSPLTEGVSIDSREFYEVHLHYADDEAARRVGDLCERAWPRTLGLLGIDPDIELEWPLGVHVYPTRERYVEVESWLTNGHFRDNESFSHWNSRTAHVALAPPLSPAAREHVVLSSQTFEVLAHEAAHLAVYAVVPSYRWHPTWFGEGLAMTVEQELAQEFGLVGDPAEHPRFATNQERAQRLLAEGRLPSVEEILIDSLPKLSFNERYALWFEFFRVLRADERRFAALMDQVQTARGGPGMRPELARFVRETYGVEPLERALRENLSALAPRWRQVYRSLETMGEAWLQCAFPGVDALAWRTEGVGATDYVLSGAAEPLGAHSQMNVLLGRRADGYLTVVLRPGSAGIHLYSAAEGWSRLAAAETDVLRSGERTPFRITVSEHAVRLDLEGEVLRAPTHGHDVTGAWGLGVQRGGSGLWHAVRVQLR